MKLLAFDTSTMTASLAVRGGDNHVAFDSAVSTHSDDLIELVERALGEAGVSLAELDAICVGAGPGSFTGLRIGMATAKGLCFASGKPLWAVSSLAALAMDGFRSRGEESLIVPVLDARRGEVFAGAWRVSDDRFESLMDERVVAPDDLGSLIADLGCADPAYLIGDGLQKYGEALTAWGHAIKSARSTPSAEGVIAVTARVKPVDVLRAGTPAYIRPSEAEIKFPDGNPGGTFSRTTTD